MSFDLKGRIMVKSIFRRRLAFHLLRIALLFSATVLFLRIWQLATDQAQAAAAINQAGFFRCSSQRLVKQELADQKNEEFYRYDNKIDLTNNEFKILKYLFLNRSKVVSRDELFKVIWGKDDKSNSSRTIDMHIKSIREKILDENKTFIVSIYGNGYKIE